MTNEFKKLTNQNETRYILEMTSGGTGSSAVASNGATPTNSIGELHRRLQELKDKITVPVNQKPRQGPLKPQTGAGAHRDKKKEQKQGVEKHKKPFYENEPDHEISMASSELQSIAADAANLLDIVKQRSEEEGLEAWQQSKITKAADFMNSVLQSIRGDEDQGVAESDGLNEYETHVYTDSQGRKWRVNDEGERELLSDPNSRYGSNRSGSRYSGRASSMQSSGMYFYNVKPGQENDALSAGLRQTKNGKWYSKFSNSAADKAFGPGKFWQPKSESVAEGDWGWDPPSKKPPERNPDWDREHDQGMDRPTPNLRPSQDVIDAEKKAAEIKQAELQRTMAALARMRGDASEGKEQKGVDEAHGNSKIYDKCWTGFRKVPGKKRGEEDSCTKIKKEDAYINQLMAALESKK